MNKLGENNLMVYSYFVKFHKQLHLTQYSTVGTNAKNSGK